MRPLQAALLVAGAGTALILLGLFGTAVSIGGLVAVIAGTVLSAPYAPRGDPGSGWWTVLAAGALAMLVGAPLAAVAGTIGGLLVVAGGVLASIGVALGFPLE